MSYTNPVVVVTPNTWCARHLLAISHWFFGLLTQAPIGHRSTKRIQFMSLQPECMPWSDLISPKAFDLERNAFWQQFGNNWESIFSKICNFPQSGKNTWWKCQIYFTPFVLLFYKTFQRHRWALVASIGQRVPFRWFISTLEFTLVCLSVPNWKTLHHTVKIRVIWEVLDDRW